MAEFFRKETGNERDEKPSFRGNYSDFAVMTENFLSTLHKSEFVL